MRVAVAICFVGYIEAESVTDAATRVIAFGPSVLGEGGSAVRAADTMSLAALGALAVEGAVAAKERAEAGDFEPKLSVVTRQ